MSAQDAGPAWWVVIEAAVHSDLGIESQQGLQAHPGGEGNMWRRKVQAPLLRPPVIRWGLARGTGVTRRKVAIPAEGPSQHQSGLTKVMQKGAISLGTVERWAPLWSHLQGESREPSPGQPWPWPAVGGVSGHSRCIQKGFLTTVGSKSDVGPTPRSLKLGWLKQRKSACRQVGAPLIPMLGLCLNPVVSNDQFTSCLSLPPLSSLKTGTYNSADTIGMLEGLNEIMQAET